MTKKQRRHSPEQIIRKLAEGHKLMAGGMSVEEVCREFGIAESSWHRWLSQYGGMKADDAKGSAARSSDRLIRLRLQLMGS